MGRSAVTPTAPHTRCEGEACRFSAAQGRARRRPAAGTRLCSGCRKRLDIWLAELPRLYAECELVLGGSSGSAGRERTTGGPLPGMPFNTAAADTRTAIMATLSSWCGLVVAERSVVAPRRAVRTLSEFLAGHADWLAGHPAVGEATEELARLAARARRVAHPEPGRRVRIGRCVRPGCAGELTASVSARGAAAPGEVRCDADRDHAWSSDQWTELSRALRGVDRSAPFRPNAERWLTASDIARLWSTPVGTVYRLASEEQWRRLNRAGRAYYCESDVQNCFDRRAGRVDRQPGRPVP